MKKRFVMVCTVLILAVLLAGGLALANAPKGTLTLALSDEPATLDPARASTAMESNVLSYVNDSLVHIDFNGNFVAGLAESWHFSDDNLTVTFTLRDDVYFHNGRKLVAEDFKYTWERALDPAFGSPLVPQLLSGVQSLETPDNRTLVINLNAPNPALMRNLAIASYLGPLAKEEVEKEGVTYGRKPVGVGPWVFSRWVTGEYIELVQNPAYNWGPSYVNPGPASLEKVILRIMPEESTRMAALQTDELSGGGVPPHLYDVYKNDPDFTFHEQMLAFAGYMVYNLDKEPFDDIRVRKAINYAIDGDTLVDVIFEGMGQAAYLPLHPKLVGYWEEGIESMGYNYNHEQASLLLEQAGWKVGRGGIRYKDKKPLEFTLWVWPAGRWPLIAEVVQAQLRALGIDAKIVSMEFATLAGLMQQGRHEASVYGYTWDGDAGTILYLILHSTQKASLNLSRYDSEKMDALLEAIMVTMDTQEREKLFYEVQEIFLKEAIFAPLFYQTSASVFSSKYSGLKIHPILDSWIIHDVIVN